MSVFNTAKPGQYLFQTSEGFYLQYFVRGSGPPVVVLPPAWGIGSTYLQHRLAGLEAEFTLIYIEFMGNGNSTRPTSDCMTRWHLAEDVEALWEELKLDAIPRLMGHSGGGTIALWCIIRYPEKVDNLVLLNHQLEDLDDSQSMEAVVSQKRQDPRSHTALEARTSSWDELSDLKFAATIQKFLPVYFYDPSCAVGYPLPTLKEAPLWNYQMLYGKYCQPRCQEGQLHDIKGRTLMVFCREDPICTPTQGLASKASRVRSWLGLSNVAIFHGLKRRKTPSER